jgi:RHS repeat-associated protein
VAVVTKSASAAPETRYLHVDPLGSLDVVSGDGAALEVERRSYDAFGARRNPRWGEPAPASWDSPRVAQGYTGHVDDDELGLVHMRGRVYDPKVGRFLTPDPIVSRPLFGQSWNAYSYVLNGPLAYVDPSGFQDATASPPEGIDPQAAASGQPIEVWVFGDKPSRPQQQDDEPNTDSAKIGIISVPTDLGFYGHTAGHIPEPPVSPALAEGMQVAGEVVLGMGEGTAELAIGIAKSLVFNALTFGGYGTYQTGRAMWDGYQEAGILGALNAVNPLYAIAKGGVDATLAMDRGDYRAAAAEGTKTAVLAIATALGAAEGVGALAGEAATARAGVGGAARGGASVALDTNAIIAAVERGQAASVLGGRVPVVPITAVKEFLRGGGSPAALHEFLAANGGRIGLAGQEATAAGLRQQAAGLGRVLHLGDSRVAAGAMREGIPLITNDRKFGNFLRAIGYPVEGF